MAIRTPGSTCWRIATLSAMSASSASGAMPTVPSPPTTWGPKGSDRQAPSGPVRSIDSPAQADAKCSGPARSDAIARNACARLACGDAGSGADDGSAITGRPQPYSYLRASSMTLPSLGS